MFLGENRFGRLWHKLQPVQHVSTPQTNLLPVFPDADLFEKETAPPTLTELETAETLVNMHDAVPIDLQQSETIVDNTTLELQEPEVMTVDQANELIFERRPVIIGNQTDVYLSDAMDKVVNYEDVSFTDPIHWLKFRDCMDLIAGRVCDFVDTVNLDNLPILEQIKTPPCWVELVQIKSTPTVKLPTLQTNHDLIALGDYFTRSKSKPKEHRKGR